MKPALGAEERAFAGAERALLKSAGVEAESRFLAAGSPDRRVHVLETGSGSPLLMIHGGNSVAAAWAPLLAELRGFHVFAPDRPGCGLSHRQDYSRVRFREHAVAFVEGVMDGLGLARATLAGNSMGGYWSLLFALARPERVESVVLLGEPAGSTRVPSLKHRLGATPLVNRLLFATVARPRPTPALFAGLMADPRRASREMLECAYAAARIPGAARAWRTMLELVARPGRATDLTYALGPELGRLSAPVLFAWGDRDFAPVAAGREIARRLLDARFEVVPDAGHLVWLDRPAAVARLVEEHLRGAARSL